jgi:hypothetical protein
MSTYAMLTQIAPSKGSIRKVFTYRFNDNWSHTVTIVYKRWSKKWTVGFISDNGFFRPERWEHGLTKEQARQVAIDAIAHHQS